MGRLVSYVALVLIWSSAGWACSRDPNLPPLTPEMQFSNAALVVVGHLTKVEEVSPPNLGKGDAGLIEGTFRPIEVLKGEAPAGNKVKSQTFQPGNCTIPLVVGADYVFFLDGGENFLTWIAGSAPLGSVDTPASQRLLERLRSFKK